jgi:hypothetical protein
VTTIVLNTFTGAVSEYDWAFHSITPGHAGDVTGLYALGGATDNGLPIVASFSTPRLQWGTSLKKHLLGVYFSMLATRNALLRVHVTGADYDYPVVVQAPGVCRAKTGRGIRENYLAITFLNVAGADFNLDRIELQDAPSTQRRL